MVFESSDCSFRSVDTMVVLWDQLDFDVVAADELSDCF
jgi:hypothetical protein